MRRQFFLVLAVLAAYGCASAGLKVSQEYAPGADVSDWRHFAWSGPVPQGSDALVSEAHKRIRDAISAELSAKGYTLVDRNRADFLVSHSIYADLDIPELSDREERARREKDIATGDLERDLPRGVGYGGHASGEGALYVFFTRPDGNAAWRGTVESILNYRGAGLDRVPGAVSKVLEDFPAQSGEE